MNFYSATRDIDCESHYFKDLKNALIYVWGPMGEAIMKDKAKGFEDSTKLYNSFSTSGNEEKMWELDAPEEWGEPYTQLGGFVEFCEVEDE